MTLVQEVPHGGVLNLKPLARARDAHPSVIVHEPVGTYPGQQLIALDTRQRLGGKARRRADEFIPGALEYALRGEIGISKAGIRATVVGQDRKVEVVERVRHGFTIEAGLH